jgi:ABC-type lipoprotein release transport system permease subunit
VCRSDSTTLVSKTGGRSPLPKFNLVGRAMQSTLYGVTALDVRAFGAVFVLLLISSCLACLIPASRASRVEPLVALRDN